MWHQTLLNGISARRLGLPPCIKYSDHYVPLVDTTHGRSADRTSEKGTLSKFTKIDLPSRNQ